MELMNGIVDQQIRQRLRTETLLQRLQRLCHAEIVYRALSVATSTVESTADEDGCEWTGCGVLAS